MHQNRSASRRTVLRRAAAAACGLATLLPARHAAAQQKASQTDAKYQNHPNGQQRCAICLNFQPPSACRIVAGNISPQGWCQFFAARENAH